jgi:very-short-patch-repair endonuclease
MPLRHDSSRRLRAFARTMRREPTDAERKLWWFLRDRRLGGFKFRRQVPVEGYIVDFLCEQASLVVELDGEQHADLDAVRYDEERTEKLARLRFRVIRFASHELVKDTAAVAATILRVLTEGA